VTATLLFLEIAFLAAFLLIPVLWAVGNVAIRVLGLEIRAGWSLRPFLIAGALFAVWTAARTLARRSGRQPRSLLLSLAVRKALLATAAAFLFLLLAEGTLALLRFEYPLPRMALS
jgi:hypothetical protein